jgi:hypothetical protein
MSYEEPPGTYIHIADVGKLHSRVNKLRRTQKEMRSPPVAPEYNPNKGVPQNWCQLAEDIGYPDKAHELPVLLEVCLNMRDPMLIDMFKKMFTYAKLSDPVLLRKHTADIRPKREAFIRQDQQYQKALRHYTSEKESRARNEVIYLEQARNSWNSLCKSLSVALERNGHNPARLQVNDAKFVNILKTRGYVDVHNHTIAVRFGTLENLDSETISEITWALLNSLKVTDQFDAPER